MPVANSRTRHRGGSSAKAKSKTTGAQRTPVRRRSAQALLALQAFAELRQYFSRDTQLVQALSWDEATIASWRREEVVRPQAMKVAQVLLLHEAAREASAYMECDAQVGEWLNAPLPNLRGATPANWVRLHGPAGLAELTRGLVEWMPRIREDDLQAIDPDAAIEYLDSAAKHDYGARELRRMLSERG